MKGILKARAESKVVKMDMVNTLTEMCLKARNDPEYKRLGITETTAIAQAFEFFLGSYEGVRETMSMFTYYMAMNPEVQERLLEEVDSVVEKHAGKVDYETVAETPYLLACIHETLRIAPGFFRLDRKCTKDWEYNGMKIKKNMTVRFPLYALHMDPDIYPDPESFNPDRFMPGNQEKLDPYAFGTFGNGPRACIGQKFAQMMLKIIIIQYMKEFTFETRKDTALNLLPGNPFFIIYDPLYINFVRRK